RKFAAEVSAVERFIDSGDAMQLAKLVTPLVKSLHGDLAWEAGPGKNTEYGLALSSAGNRSLREDLDHVIAMDTKIEKWDFHHARHPKPIPPRIELPTRGIALQSGQWQFTAHRSKDGRVDLEVFDDALAELPEKDAVTAVFVFLDAALGEDL